LPGRAELVRFYQEGDYFSSPYFQLADEEAQTSHFRRFRSVADLLKGALAPEEIVLEVGPGRGTFLRMLLDRGMRAEALELSPRAAHRLGQSLSFPVVAGELENHPFSPERFAAVTAFDVLEHCLDPKEWLRAAWRVLRPGGVLALSTVNIDNLLDRLGKLFHRMGFRGPLTRLYPLFHLYYGSSANRVGKFC
jgi:2-polyprenyl-3-methyl-5-hydroxy-6-metoxy-1,4-benzoquinol methylase